MTFVQLEEKFFESFSDGRIYLVNKDLKVSSICKTSTNVFSTEEERKILPIPSEQVYSIGISTKLDEMASRVGGGTESRRERG